MTKTSRIALAVAALVLTTQASAQVTFYERDGYAGRSFSTRGTVAHLERFGFNDRASSAMVGRERWEVCEDAAFRGRCVVLRQGRYPSLAAMGLNDRISSAREVSERASVDDTRYAPPPAYTYDDRRRRGERLYEARVTGVRAVVGQADRRCWMERDQGNSRRGDASVAGGIAGAVIGGILGHQVGGGSGRDLATVGGVVAGAAIGANVGRDNRGRHAATHDVERCANEQGGQPEYWDVTYTFRGQEHRMQTTTPPGPTVTVNRQGEPRAE